jgi:hypothetical protein
MSRDDSGRLRRRIHAVNECGQAVGTSGTQRNDSQAILWATDLR